MPLSRRPRPVPTQPWATCIPTPWTCGHGHLRDADPIAHGRPARQAACRGLAGLELDATRLCGWTASWGSPGNRRGGSGTVSLSPATWTQTRTCEHLRGRGSGFTWVDAAGRRPGAAAAPATSPATVLVGGRWGLVAVLMCLSPLAPGHRVTLENPLCRPSDRPSLQLLAHLHGEKTS